MDLAEDYIKSVVRYVLKECAEDIAFFNERVDPEKVRSASRCTDLVLSISLAACLSVGPTHVLLSDAVCTHFCLPSAVSLSLSPSC
jgi:hypothetical protein